MDMRIFYFRHFRKQYSEKSKLFKQRLEQEIVLSAFGKPAGPEVRKFWV